MNLIKHTDIHGEFWIEFKHSMYTQTHFSLSKLEISEG